MLSFQPGSRGRVVKASDSKSDSLWERRFESCRLRQSIIFCIIIFSAKLFLDPNWCKHGVTFWWKWFSTWLNSSMSIRYVCVDIFFTMNNSWYFFIGGSSAYVDGRERPLLSKSQFDTNYNDVPHNSRIGFSYTIAVHKALKKRYLFTLLNKNFTLFLTMPLTAGKKQKA